MRNEKGEGMGGGEVLFRHTRHTRKQAPVKRVIKTMDFKDPGNMSSKKGGGERLKSREKEGSGKH